MYVEVLLIRVLFTDQLVTNKTSNKGAIIL